MKITKTALLAAIACAFGGNALAQQTSQPSAYSYGYYADDAAPVAKQVSHKSRAAMAEVIPASCSCSDAPVSDCDSSACGNGCDGIGDGCDGGCNSIGGCGDDPWKLFPNNPFGLTIGGWSQMAYFDGATNLSFNNYANHVQLQQQWLYAEKIADGSCGLGFGGRIDYLYGTDAPDTQAFGTPNNSWDNGWDNGGAYGNAIPQLYGEVAYGDLSVKLGHFFTIVGNEVVAATGNFFYSRQLMFYNAEPFTHTGALTAYKVGEDTTLWNGYVTGWDSGFYDNGDAYIGGFSTALTDDIGLIYTTTMGRFNEGFGVRPNENGQIQSVILTAALTDNLKYISQADYLYTTDSTGASVRNTFGTDQYLIYAVNDCTSVGGRFEWWNYSSQTGAVNGVVARNSDVYNLTTGVNQRINSNLIVRPEVRWIWDRELIGFNSNGGTSQTVFGVDGIFTF